MERNLGLLIAALLVAAAPLCAAAEEVTLRGEVVDVTCYGKQGVAKGTGASHVSCALDCAKQGKPLGLWNTICFHYRLYRRLINASTLEVRHELGRNPGEVETGERGGS